MKIDLFQRSLSLKIIGVVVGIAVIIVSVFSYIDITLETQNILATEKRTVALVSEVLLKSLENSMLKANRPEIHNVIKHLLEQSQFDEVKIIKGRVRINGENKKS
mgnify:CR=1 FL=1